MGESKQNPQVLPWVMFFMSSEFEDKKFEEAGGFLQGLIIVISHIIALCHI